MTNGVEHRHKRDGSSARTRTAAIVGVTGLLAIVGLCAVASAAASGSGKADGNVMERGDAILTRTRAGHVAAGRADQANRCPSSRGLGGRFQLEW